jgi:hypothetical protein
MFLTLGALPGASNAGHFRRMLAVAIVVLCLLPLVVMDGAKDNERDS